MRPFAAHRSRVKGAGRKSPVNPAGLALSEEEFERELDNARTSGRRDHSEVSALRNVAVTEVVSRASDVHVVEEVKELCAELQLHLLADGEILDRAEVSLEEPGSPQSVLSRVSERSDGVGHEFRGIEITRDQLPVRTTAVELCIAGNIGPVSADFAKRVVLAAID